MAASTSTLYNDTRLGELVNDAYIWATGLFSWPELEEAVDTVVPVVDPDTNEQYLDYPENFKTDTLTEFIHVNDIPFERTAWNAFLEYKRNNPTDTSRKMFADYGRQIFLFPHQTVGLPVVLWGQKQATALSAGTDLTIFSKHSDEGNEAVIRKAFSVAVRRTDTSLSKSEEAEAVALLSALWSKVQARQQYTKQTDKPMFEVPDYFAGANGGYVERNFTRSLN